MAYYLEWQDRVATSRSYYVATHTRGQELYRAAGQDEGVSLMDINFTDNEGVEYIFSLQSEGYIATYTNNRYRGMLRYINDYMEFSPFLQDWHISQQAQFFLLRVLKQRALL